MDKDSNECTVTVNLVKRKNGGVGILASNASPYLAVSHVVKGGVADETGFIEVGDVILEVNGKSLENVPYLKALESIDKAPVGESLALKIRARDGFQANLETAFDKEGVAKTVRRTKPNTSPESGMDGKVSGEKQEEKNAINDEKLTLNGTAENDQEIAHPDNGSDSRSESNCVQKCPVTNASTQFQQPKHINLENLLTNTFTTDTLHQKAIQVS